MTMKIPRAVICDVYGTLLEVGPAPADAEERWQGLCRRLLGVEAPRSWSDHQQALRSEVRRVRSLAQAGGVAVPEVVWDDVVGAVLPAFASLPPADRDAFQLEQAGLNHQVRLFPGAGAVLSRWKAEGVLLGIASNAQPYSEAELQRELATEGLTMELFDGELSFWSWRHGFSKPDPHVFRVLDVRLRRRGIDPSTVWMMGDRLDNDIAPARALGWGTWHLSKSPGTNPGGDWDAVAAWWWGGETVDG